MMQTKPQAASLILYIVIISHLLLGFACVDIDKLLENGTSGNILGGTPLKDHLSSSRSDEEAPRLNAEESSTVDFSKTKDLFDNPLQEDDLATTSEEIPAEDAIATNPNPLLGKHPSLAECTLLTLEPGEYAILPNRSLTVEVYNLTYNESMFFVIGGIAHFCDPDIYKAVLNEDAKFLPLTENLTRVGLYVSMICLFVHLVAFAWVPDLRNLPGWNLAALCLSLLASYTLCVVIGEARGHPEFCFPVALLTHFFFMSSFMWMTVMSFDVYMSLLRVTGNLRISSTHFKLKKFALNSACAFGVAFAFSTLAFLADTLEGVPAEYRPLFRDKCWFSGKTPLLVFFAAPVIALTCLNFLFFVLSACTIYHNEMKLDEDDHKSVLRRNYLTYFRLSAIMGVTWVVGIVAVIVHAAWLWVLFVGLNTVQGLYIFLAFTCSVKVKKVFRQKFLGGRWPSQQTLSPTFQSYCFYANSIEKDLDKMVDGKAKGDKDVIDTVVIHL